MGGVDWLHLTEYTQCSLQLPSNSFTFPGSVSFVCMVQSVSRCMSEHVQECTGCVQYMMIMTTHKFAHLGHDGHVAAVEEYVVRLSCLQVQGINT